VEVPDGLVDGHLAIAVLDDHPSPDHIHLRDPIEVDAALVAQLLEHQPS